MATELPRQLNVAIDGDAVTLANCPPGPFLFNGILGFKTEYGAMSGKDIGGGKVEWEVSGGPDVYVMDSGETFWGGTTTKEARSALMVNPVELYFQDMPAPVQHLRVTVEEHNAAFDPADEALGGAFKDGFREGWLFAKSPDFEDREEAEEDYPRDVDMAPTECWDAYREKYFGMLPLAAIPDVGSAKPDADASHKRLREAIQWCLDRDNRNGSLPEAYAERLRAALAAEGRE